RSCKWAWAPLARQSRSAQSRKRLIGFLRSGTYRIAITRPCLRIGSIRRADSVRAADTARKPGALEREDRLGQLQVAGVQLRCLGADVLQGCMQTSTTNFTLAGDKAGGIVTGGQYDLVVFERRAQVGNTVSGGDQGATNHIGGAHKAGGAGHGGQAEQGG